MAWGFFHNTFQTGLFIKSVLLPPPPELKENKACRVSWPIGGFGWRKVGVLFPEASFLLCCGLRFVCEAACCLRTQLEAAEQLSCCWFKPPRHETHQSETTRSTANSLNPESHSFSFYIVILSPNLFFTFLKSLHIVWSDFRIVSLLHWPFFMTYM